MSSAARPRSRDSITTGQRFEGDFGGNQVKGHAVLNGEKGWRKFGDQSMDMDPDAVKNEKRNVYLMVVPATILPLKSKELQGRVRAR